MTVSLPPARSACRRVLLAQLLERGDVGLVVLGDVRDDVPGVAEMLGGLAADVAERLALDLAPLREIGKRLLLRGRAGRRAAADRPPTPAPARTNPWTSSTVMRPPGPVPVTWRMSTPSSRAMRRTDGAAGGARGRRRPARAACGAARGPRLMSTTSPRFCRGASSISSSGAAARRAARAAARRRRLVALRSSCASSRPAARPSRSASRAGSGRLFAAPSGSASASRPSAFGFLRAAAPLRPSTVKIVWPTLTFSPALTSRP